MNGNYAIHPVNNPLRSVTEFAQRRCIASGHIRERGIGADIGGDTPGPGAFDAFSQRRFDTDGGNIVEPEGLRWRLDGASQ
jgi:hypothetical protein